MYDGLVTRVEIHQAKARLDELVDRAVAGEQIVLTRQDEPVVQPMPERQGGSVESLAGLWRDRVRIADDFDDLPDDLAESFVTRPSHAAPRFPASLAETTTTRKPLHRAPLLPPGVPPDPASTKSGTTAAIPQRGRRVGPSAQRVRQRDVAIVRGA